MPRVKEVTAFRFACFIAVVLGLVGIGSAAFAVKPVLAGYYSLGTAIAAVLYGYSDAIFGD